MRSAVIIGYEYCELLVVVDYSNTFKCLCAIDRVSTISIWSTTEELIEFD